MKPKPITPHLWFNTQVQEAVDFYITAIPDSRITSTVTLRDTPSGDAKIISFELGGQPFMAINGGDHFKPNPSISFFVNFDPSRDPKAKENLDQLWQKLSPDAQILMPLQAYDFSPHYGWIQDRFGISWQLMLTNPEGEPRPFIIPSLLFVNDVAGKAEEATDFYLSVFKDSERGAIARYPAGMEPDQEGTLMFTDFRLLGTWMAAMDSAHEHTFNFNEGISFIVPCDNQAEVDYYWEKLSAAPEAAQCGWLKDKYGVSWQITPTALDKMMAEGTQEQIDRLTQELLPMKKLDINRLEKAFYGS